MYTEIDDKMDKQCLLSIKTVPLDISIHILKIENGQSRILNVFQAWNATEFLLPSIATLLLIQCLTNTTNLQIVRQQCCLDLDAAFLIGRLP